MALCKYLHRQEVLYYNKKGGATIAPPQKKNLPFAKVFFFIKKPNRHKKIAF
jgi:hypothetical protein